MCDFKFSVILCTYNGAERINRVIDSVLNQSGVDRYVNEIIIVNNNSTDNTDDIINNNLEKSDKILKVNQKIQGLSYARLKGIETCTSEWIIFIDDDNLLCEGWIEYAHKYIEENKLVGAFNGAVAPSLDEKLSEEEKIILKNVLQGLACTHTDFNSVDKKQKKHPYKIPFGAGLVIRTSPLKELAKNGWLSSKGRTSETLTSCEDTEMCLFIKSKGYKFGYNPEMKIKHLINKNRLKKEYLNKLWCGFADGNYNLLQKSNFGKYKIYVYLFVLYARILRDKFVILDDNEYKIKSKLNDVYRKQYIKNMKS